MQGVTLDDIKQIVVEAVKNGTQGFATKDDLKNFATKDDLKNFATKDDLKNFATKDDLKNFATKDDLSAFATKDYVDQAVTTILEAVQSESELTRKEADDRYHSMIEHKDDNMKIYHDRYQEVKSDISALDLRVKVLEEA